MFNLYDPITFSVMMIGILVCFLVTWLLFRSTGDVKTTEQKHAERHANSDLIELLKMAIKKTKE